MKPMKITGRVVHGKALGRTVGMPTANLCAEGNAVLPEEGVYAARVNVDGKRYQAVTNVGARPSVDSDPSPTVESFILDFSEDIYGKIIAVELIEKIRPVKRMRSLEAVKAQVEKDVQTARSIITQFEAEEIEHGE